MFPDRWPSVTPTLGVPEFTQPIWFPRKGTEKISISSGVVTVETSGAEADEGVELAGRFYSHVPGGGFLLSALVVPPDDKVTSVNAISSTYNREGNFIENSSSNGQVRSAPGRISLSEKSGRADEIFFRELAFYIPGKPGAKKFTIGSFITR